MLQRWFAATRHERADDPFFLYGASNFGAILAVLSYPLLVEPTLRLADQSRLWAGGYVLFVVLALVCAAMLWFSSPSDVSVAAPLADSDRRPSWAQRLKWLVLALVPSSLMLSVTTYISTDIAAMPMLWMGPLALYLLSFVVAFARRPVLSHRAATLMLPVVMLPPIISLMLGTARPIAFQIPAHLIAFFVIAVVCHGELARTRPSAAHLTDFYFWLSLGGVLGGLFNVLVAPAIFSTQAEYPLGLVAALFLRPSDGATERLRPGLHLPVPLAIGALAVLIHRSGFSLANVPNYHLAVGLPLIICVFFWHRIRLFALSVAVLLAFGASVDYLGGQILSVSRTFFGVHRVILDAQGEHRQMVHGGTVHGMQAVDPNRREEPLSYYGRTSPIGQLFAARAKERPVRRVAVLGLGVGTLATYSHPGEQWTFFEISPAVERQARDARFFSYLSDCGAVCDVVIGDARVSLEQRQDGRGPFDVIVLDVFDSDAIPVHLLTREAMTVYLSRLAPGGVLAIHTSNLYVELVPVVAALARDQMLAGLVQNHDPLPEEEERGLLGSQWVLVARDRSAFGLLVTAPSWEPMPADPSSSVWTDDFSNVFSALRWPDVADLLPGD
jgi:spermidine synthase